MPCSCMIFFQDIDYIALPNLSVPILNCYAAILLITTFPHITSNKKTPVLGNCLLQDNDFYDNRTYSCT